MNATPASGVRKHHTTVTETIIHLRSGRLSAPAFTLFPVEILLRIASVFGDQDLGFDSHPKFTKDYVLRGKDEVALRAFFAPPILEYFELHPGLTVEPAPAELFVFHARRTMKPEEVAARVEEALAIHDLFVAEGD